MQHQGLTVAGYSEEDKARILNEVFEWVANGGTVREYCRQDGTPCNWTIYAWINADEELATRIVRARAIGCDPLAEETKELIDAEPETAKGYDDKGNLVSERIDPAWVQLQRARVDQRMRLMSKWNSGRYGDKSTVEHQGGVNVTVVTGVPQVDEADDGS